MKKIPEEYKGKALIDLMDEESAKRLEETEKTLTKLCNEFREEMSKEANSKPFVIPKLSDFTK